MPAMATIQMWEGVPAVRIPQNLADATGLEPGTTVMLTPCDRGLLIHAMRPQKHCGLAELLAQCKGRKNPHREAMPLRAGREAF